MLNHALAPGEGVAAVVAGTIEQLAKVHVEVAQKGLDAVDIAQGNPQVTAVFTRPGFKAKHLAVAQPWPQGLAGLQVFVGHGAQWGQAQLHGEQGIAGTGKLPRRAGAQAGRQHAQHLLVPGFGKTPAGAVVGNFEFAQTFGLELPDFLVQALAALQKIGHALGVAKVDLVDDGQHRDFLSLHSYGGYFYRPRFTYTATFTNVTGTPSKNITVSLEKKPKTSGSWTIVTTKSTGTTGIVSYDEFIDTTYWAVRLEVKGDTMSTGPIVSVADAQKVNQYVLGTATPAGFDFYSSDVNGDNQITISDAYVIFGRIAGRFSTWVNNVKDIKFFTSSEYTTINAATTNLTATTPGVTNFTYDIVAGQPNSVTYYVLGMGDANGTGL